MVKPAVAYVVLNRKKSVSCDNIKAVVTHPGQFEPWTHEAAGDRDTFF